MASCFMCESTLEAQRGISSQAIWNAVLLSYQKAGQREKNLGQPFNLIVNFALMCIHYNMGAWIKSGENWN